MILQSRDREEAVLSPSEHLLSALWVGKVGDRPAQTTQGDEMALAFAWAQQHFEVTVFHGPAEASRHDQAGSPAVILLPMAWSGAVCSLDLIKLARRWPLAALVVITGTVVDGQRRRGPPLPGGLMVPWYELPGRIGQWYRQRFEGTESPLGMPVTSRREERLLGGFAAGRKRPQRSPQVSVAAGSRSLLDALEMLTVTAGFRVLSRHQGPPPIAAEGDMVLWDAGSVGKAEVAHAARLCQARKSRPLLIFEAFPRGTTAVALREVGGAHLLGQLIEADVLGETIRWAWRSPSG